MTRRSRTLLGFDYGSKKIGVAIGQTLTATATPLACVKVREKGPDWMAITGLIETWQPDAFVVGLPLNMDGTEQSMTRAARRFGNQLAGRFGRPVYRADERLSTVEAKQRLAAAGTPGDDDAVAAQVILETWLNAECENSTTSTPC